MHQRQKTAKSSDSESLTQCAPGRKHHGFYDGICQWCGALQRDVRRAQLDRLHRYDRTQTAQSQGDTAKRA